MRKTRSGGLYAPPNISDPVDDVAPAYLAHREQVHRAAEPGDQALLDSDPFWARYEGGMMPAWLKAPPRYKRPPDEDPDTPPELLPSSVMHPDHDTFRGFITGSWQRTKDLYNSARANTAEGCHHFSDTLATAAEWLAGKTGLEPGGLFRELADHSMAWAKHYHGKVRYKDFMTNVMGGILGAGPGIMQFSYGPVWAAFEGMTEDGIRGAVLGFGRRWFAGKVFSGLHDMPSVTAKGATGGAFFAAESAAFGERDPAALGEAFATGVAFTARAKKTPMIKVTERMRFDATSDIFAELNRAVEAKEMTPMTAEIAKRFVMQRPDIDADTQVKVLNEIKLATDDILLTEGIAPGTPAVITGKYAPVRQNDLMRFGIEIYVGHTPSTLIEEFFHRDFDMLSLRERREAEPVYEKSEATALYPRRIDEWYAQEKTREFFETAGWQPMTPMGRLQDMFRGLVQRVKKIPGNKADDAISEIKEAAQVKVGDESHQVTPAAIAFAGRELPPEITPEQILSHNLPDPRPKYVSKNINLDHIKAPEDIMAAIDKVGRAYEGSIDEARRGTQTREQLMLLAEESGMTVDQLLKRKKGEAFNAEQAIAARQILAASSLRLVNLARTAQGVDASDRDLAAFRTYLATHTAIQKQVAGMTAEAGRLLRSFGFDIKGEAHLNRVVSEIIQAEPGGRDQIQAKAEALASAVELSEDGKISVKQVNQMADKLRKAKTPEMILEAWINGILSGPQTHAANCLSNQLVMMSQIPERWLAAQVGKLHKGEKVYAQEAMAMTLGMIRGTMDGLRLMGTAISTGQGSDLMGKVEIPRRAITAENMGIDPANWIGRAVDLAGEAVRLPGRMLMAEDEYFKAVAYRMELQARAVRTALSEGLEGRDYLKRVKEVLADPPEDLHLAACEFAKYVTFTNELGETGKKLGSWLNSHAMLKFVVPFHRTPTNVFKYAFARTPVAPLLMQSVREDLMAGGARRDLAVARIGLGSMIMGTASAAVVAGFITGGGPADHKQRKALRQTGWQPYSLKIDGKYHSYARLEPLGSLIGMAADATEIVMNSEDLKDQTDVLVTVAAVFGRQVTSKTFTQGFGQIIHALDDPVRYGNTYVERMAGSLVPNVFAQLNRAFDDPVMREAYGVIDAIKARTPWSEGVLPRRDMWGYPIKSEGTFGPDFLSPIWISKEKGGKLEKEIVAHKIGIPKPPRTVSISGASIKLTPEQYDRYQELSGHAYQDPATGLGLKAALDQLVETKAYQSRTPGPDGGRALEIKNIVHRYRAAALRQLTREYPEIEQTAIQQIAVATELLGG